jgi:hypoxanthine phosphoribosyltransferase
MDLAEEARMKPDDVLFTADQIRQRVAELGAAIRKQYGRKPLTVVAVLHGSIAFVADLCEHLPGHLTVEMIQAASYGDAMASSGEVTLSRYGQLAIAGRHVLLVDDIVDTGRTLAAVRSMVEAMGPLSVRTCVLLDKPSRREVQIAIDYRGFEVPDVFVVGYGLDHAGRFRDLPYIARLDEP